MSWLSALFGSAQETSFSDEGMKKADALLASGSGEAGGLNFKSAIEAHVKWKARLQAIMDGSSGEKLDPRVVAKDSECELGKWIYGGGGDKYGFYPHFKQMCAEHAKFHRSAANVLELSLDGNKELAKKEMAQGDFRSSSLAVTGALAGLFVELHNK